MIKVNLICIITILLGISGNANAQNDMLDKKQEKIITISALTAKGDLERLKPELVAGLEAGLTVLATAHAVSEGIMRGVSDELSRKAAPSTYGATGRANAPGRSAAQPLAISRVL